MRQATLAAGTLALAALLAPPAGADEGRAPAERYTVRLEYLLWSPPPSGQLVELLLSARVHVVDRFAVTGGFRKLVLEGRDDRDFFHLDLGTWTLGVELSL